MSEATQKREAQRLGAEMSGSDQKRRSRPASSARVCLSPNAGAACWTTVLL